VRVARSEIDAWAAAVDRDGDTKRTIQAFVLDNSDGVTSQAIPYYYRPQVTESLDGKLWFVNLDGVSTYDPRHLPFNKLPPPVHIEQITADRKTYDSASYENGYVSLPARVRDLAIDYTALSFVAPEKVHFRFKLEGQDTDWREVINSRHVEYSNLAPKRYRFLVKASNNSGVWNETGAFLDFSIAPAYYQTTWFRSVCMAVFLVLLWGMYRFRVQQLHHQFAIGLEARVNERTRIARELHDTLLQSFQGVAFQLQAARNLLVRKSDNAEGALDEAVVAAEEAIKEGRSAIRDLRPEQAAHRDLPQLLNDVGRELAAIREMDAHVPSYRMVVEGKQEELSPMLQDEIYRISREVIRNAFTHAIAANVEVEIRYDKDQLRLRIRDDGKGIDPRVLEGDGPSGHYGIPGMRERAQRIGAQLEFWSEMGAGTEVQLTVPASIAYQKRRSGHRFRLIGRAGKDERRS